MDDQSLARDTLKALIAQGLPLTPVHYARVFAELSGLPEQSPNGPLLDDWLALLRRLLTEWERSQEGLSYLSKIRAREAQFSQSRDLWDLYERLQHLVHQWEGYGNRGIETKLDVTPEETSIGFLQVVWRRGLHGGFHAALNEDAESQALFQEMESLLPAPGTHLGRIIEIFRSLWQRLDAREEYAEHTRRAYRQLLELLVNNLNDLADDELWLAQQLALIHEAIRQPAPSPDTLEHTISSIKMLVLHQESRRGPVGEARRALQALLDLVFEYLHTLNEESESSQVAISGLQGELERAQDWTEIRRIVAAIVDNTRQLQDRTRRSLAAIQSARGELEQAKQRVHDMESELSAMSVLVHQDPLTEALNRRGLMAVLERELARMHRNPGVFSLALLDLDHFKRINDHYGHDRGDQVLKDMVQTLRQTLRTSDVIARHGGEEFVILFPDTEPQYAKTVLERVLDWVSKPDAAQTQAQIPFSFSAGIVAWQPEATIGTLLRAADEALYKAKKSGRKCILIADERLS